MSGRVLLDTSIVVDLLAGEPSVRASLRRAEEVFLSSITPGELPDQKE